MNPEEQKAFDEVQAQKAEIGIVDTAEDTTEEDKNSEESTEEKDDSKENNESEESEEDEDESDDDEEESEEDSDESDEDDSDDEESDDDEETHHPKQVSLKEYKNMKRELRDEIKKLKDEYSKKAPDEKVKTSIDDRAKKLAASLDFDVDKVKLILEEARDVALDEFQSKNVMSEEDKKTFDSIKQQRFVESQEKIFNTQWDKTIGEIKKSYPNATPEQITKARSEMDALAHSKQHHTHEMEYILFKEKQKFDKILFSPKQKTFESSRPSVQSEEDTDFPEFNPNMSPAEFERFEKRRQSFSDTGREKVKVTGMNPKSGKIETREM